MVRPARRHNIKTELTPGQRRSILYYLQETDWSLRKIAQRFDVEQAIVGEIRNEAGLQKRHVNRDPHSASENMN